MKKIRTAKQARLYILIGMIAASIVSCKKDNSTPATNTLDELIKQDTSLTIFSAILQRSHLDIYSKGPGPFTLFAPTNNAYLAQGISSVADVAQIDSTYLMNKTAYLVATGIQSSNSLVGLNVPIATTLGTNISASAYSNYTFFNGFYATKRDVPASNGLLQKMDICLLPNTNSTTATLALYPGAFKLFSQAIARATSGATVVNTSTTTLFAPTNNAMLAAGYDSATIANTSAATLATLVKYHTITTRYYTFALSTGNTKTALGKMIYLNMNATTPTVQGNSNTSPSNFISGALLPTPPVVLSTFPSINLTTGNGVIHTIDQVLKP